MRIVFHDAAARVAYSVTARNDPELAIGGTENSVALVAEALATDRDVAVVQTHRRVEETSGGVRWLPEAGAAGREALRRAEVVVVLREVSVVPRIRLLCPRARIVVWYHDWHETSTGRLGRWRTRKDSLIQVLIHRIFVVEALAVSATHVGNIQGSFRQLGLLGHLLGCRAIPLRFIYNPVAEGWAASFGSRPVEHDKLIYFSAAWKGLDDVLEAFRFVQKHIPGLRLFVACPGYDPAPAIAEDGVLAVGTLAKAQLIEHVQSSLCTFYPAAVVPETFGLVFVESHAAGTPVLAHRFGAAPEHLLPEELVNARDHRAILETILRWRNGGRPLIKSHPRYELSAVAGEWRQYLDGR